jgi:hypothetical protein
LNAVIHPRLVFRQIDGRRPVFRQSGVPE